MGLGRTFRTGILALGVLVFSLYHASCGKKEEASVITTSNQLVSQFCENKFIYNGKYDQKEDSLVLHGNCPSGTEGRLGVSCDLGYNLLDLVNSEFLLVYLKAELIKKGDTLILDDNGDIENFKSPVKRPTDYLQATSYSDLFE